MSIAAESSAQPECGTTGSGATRGFAQLMRSPREQTVLLALFLAAATLALYEPSLHHNFVNYDDDVYVTANEHIREGLSWSNVRWALTDTSTGNWHPLTLVSHMADVQFFGLAPAGHHLVSILWHTLNVVLLFLLLRKATGYLLRSAILAALFSVFPLNVEPVAWIAERKSLLCTAFFLVALFAYGWYGQRPSVGRYLSVAGLFALGLMAKPMIVTLPAVLLLIDYWPLERLGIPGFPSAGKGVFGANFARLVAEKAPLLALSSTATLLAAHAARAGGAFASTALLPMKLREKNAIYSYAVYLLKGIWPSRLAAFYPHPEDSLVLWKVVGAALVLAAITGVIWHYRERRYLLFGWLWYLVTMLPMIGLTQAGRQAMADRYAYIPFLGLFLMAVWLGSELAARIPSSKWLLSVITLLAFCGYAWVSRTQIGYWRDSYTLFSHTLQVTRRNAIAENNLGEALVEMGRPDLAMPRFEKAVDYEPRSSQAHYNLATMLQKQKRFDEAMREYRLALTYTSNADEAVRTHNNLGTLLLLVGRQTEALSEYNAALGINPNEPNSLLGRGYVEYGQKTLAPAHRDLLQAAQLLPSSSFAYFWLGRVLEDEGDLKSAASAYEAALKMTPTMSDAQSRLEEIRRKLSE